MGVPGGAPICCAAHCRHAESSTWNSSKGLCGAGSTITLGPVGTVAQPPNTNNAINTNRDKVLPMMSPVLLPTGQGGLPEGRPSSSRLDIVECTGNIPGGSGCS